MEYYIIIRKKNRSMDNVYKNIYDILKNCYGTSFRYNVEDIKKVTGYNDQQVKTVMRALTDKKCIELVNENEYKEYKKEEKKNNRTRVDVLNRLVDKYTENLELRDVLYSFIQFRKQIKKPITEYALNLAFKKLNECITDRDRIIAVTNSIEHGWTAIYVKSAKDCKETKELMEDLDLDYYKGILVVEEDRKRGLKYAQDIANELNYAQDLKLARALVLGEEDKVE